jgi:hypothetical protein
MMLPLFVALVLTSTPDESWRPPLAGPPAPSPSTPEAPLELQARLRPDAAPSSDSSWALHVNLSGPGAGGSMVLLGGAGLGSPVFLGSSATAGLNVERALGQHWSVGLGLGGGAGLAGDSRSASVSVVPSVRWYASRVLDGGWVALELPLGTRTSWTSGGVGAKPFTGLTGGAELLLGWTFRVGPRMLLSLAGGPSASLARYSGFMFGSESGGDSSLTTANLGLRGQLSVGVAL